MTQEDDIKGLREKVRVLQIELEQARTVPVGIESKTLHDLNGALAVAQGQAHLALIDLPDNSQARPSVEEVCKALRKALSLVALLHENRQEMERTASAENPDIECYGSGSVFFIDDEEDMREMVQKVLKHYGYRVRLASNGQEALHIFEKNHQDIDLVFMDMTMPRLNGLETFKIMRRIDPSMPIIMTSGYSEVNLAEKWPELGMNGFLRKPCDLKTLLLTVSQAIRKPSGGLPHV
jgi:CheY-like chemotaxis protein